MKGEREPATGRVGREAEKGLGVLRETLRKFARDNCFRLAAALAYYAVFTFAPLLVLALVLAGRFIGGEFFRSVYAPELERRLDQGALQALDAFVRRTAMEGSDAWTAAWSGLVMLAASTSLFHHLRGALDVIWRTPERIGGGLRHFLIRRLGSLAFSLGVVTLLLLSLFLDSLVAAGAGMLAGAVGLSWTVVAVVGENVLAVIVSGAVFGLLFKLLPETRIAWGDVWPGALATGALFTVGGSLAGLYLAGRDYGDVYGSAGAVILFLIWVFYVCLLALLGAEFTWVWANRRGSIRREREERGIRRRRWLRIARRSVGASGGFGIRTKGRIASPSEVGR